MDTRTKLTILADAAKYDASCASGGAQQKGDGVSLGSRRRMGICHSYTPDGRCISLLKILLTNYCIYDCHYCTNRISSDIPRATFTPKEVVQLLLDFYRRNYVEGLFLSSGIIKSPDFTMERLVEVARSLREDHGFRGYIHLKTVPGVAAELLTKAGRFADRLSVNIEVPTAADLALVAPEKRLDDVEKAMEKIWALREESKHERAKTPRAPSFAPAGQSTQMVVGATPSPDATILQTSQRLYTSYGLRRVYYSAYSPIPEADPRLPLTAPSLWREHRLYQADWLLRFYGFSPSEIAPPEHPNLPLHTDPKLAWALRNLGDFPVDVNRASREQLVRVPGLGVRNVLRILELRRHQEIRIETLARLGVRWQKVRYFVETADGNPYPAWLTTNGFSRLFSQGRGEQLSLFPAGAHPTSAPLLLGE